MSPLFPPSFFDGMRKNAFHSTVLFNQLILQENNKIFNELVSIRRLPMQSDQPEVAHRPTLPTKVELCKLHKEDLYRDPGEVCDPVV